MPADALHAARQHHAAGRLAEAEPLYRRALAANPADPGITLPLGRLLSAQGRQAEAIPLLQQAVTGLPALGEAHLALGDALHAARRTADAIETYRWAVAVDPRLAAAWHRLGHALAALGQTDDAVSCLRRAVALDPDLLTAQADLAASGCADGLEHLARTLQRPDLGDDARIEAGFALAGLLDRRGQVDDAFRLFAASNALVRRRLTALGHAFDADAVRAEVDRLIATCDPAFFAARRSWGVADPRPVFVVGMPRSGTTLAEQIIASHSQAAGLGEGPEIGALSALLAGRDAAEHRRLAASHLAGFDARAPGAARVVDKTPDNLFHLGLIAVLFPGARIVLCRRDPRDICLSCFCQHFAEPIAYAADLADCARRLQEVDRLAAHWQAVLRLPIHTLSYEALVARPEQEARRLLAFLGLAWEPGCLDFHRQGHDVRSASVWQVRQPVHTASAGRWRRYRDHLGVLLDVFGRD